MREKLTKFDEQDLKFFEPEAKIGLLATINQGGLPHITLITALQAKTPRELIWGQFSEGQSKQNVRRNNKTGFLIMTLDKSLWRGKALWREEATHGADYDMFNNKPMFRYNAYFGIHTVHYMDLVETYGRETLPLLRIGLGAILTKIAKPAAKQKNNAVKILKPWAENLFNLLNSIKFISFIDHDGFPAIIPLIQCQAADSTRLVFSPLAYQEELSALRKNSHVAVFGLTLDMEDVLVRGKFTGFEKHRGINLGVVDINWVYNPMPPKPGQIYPPQEIKAVANF
ncbi:MAG TPA: hypothetical protein P5294_03305 [Smithellaceae bacterium]|nr:hypothetical protein [Smithellaceae bacterium]HRS88484.1 hypothetical protein [Smithellaceae bacterium]HRV25540.1 hypothetical protein [Smithellaceae bacterium]